jgi:hypothetical protein
MSWRGNVAQLRVSPCELEKVKHAHSTTAEFGVQGMVAMVVAPEAADAYGMIAAEDENASSFVIQVSCTCL